jgi:hypothetical protein
MKEVGTLSAAYSAPLGYRLRRLGSDVRRWLRDVLFRASMVLCEQCNSVAHAKRELAAVGYDAEQEEEGPDKWIQQNLLDLLCVFSMQGHSGFSAGYCVSAFEKLARFEPLGPLTGADEEWFDHGDGMCQNKRCSHVFKQPDRFNGQAYDIYGRIFREPNGCTYTSGDSHVPITFPYTPKREYVDVPASQD